MSLDINFNAVVRLLVVALVYVGLFNKIGESI